MIVWANMIYPLLCLSGLYIGFGLGIVFVIQISSHISANDIYGIPFIGIYPALFPINYILCSIRLIRNTIKFQVKSNSNSVYKNLLSRSTSWLILPFILALPLLAILILLLVLFGQQPDAIIKAFTETSDWTLSQKISPPPVEYDGHYLCTVALKGDKKLVKPTRMGFRQGVKIVVNRQLCIANAFEQAIQEKSPRLHRIIRDFYDKHGYPLSKKITTSKRANITYLFMKPLEWFFILFLYTVDVNPENRIAMQYTKR